jgi:N-acetylglucosaminyl-diphospho-decaprenol L-rhamnosyltransferase
MMSDEQTLSVVIVNWNTRELLHNCLKAIGPIDNKHSFIIVDNGSTDGSQAMVRSQFPNVTLIANRDNLGFAAANNQGISATNSRYVLLLNSDTVASPQVLQDLAAFMEEHPDAGACSPRLVGTDGTPQHYAYGGDPTIPYLLRRALARLILRRPLHDWDTNDIQTVDWVSGACMMVRREAIQQVGLLDEDFFMYFEDNDWCLRMRKHGWRIYFNPQIEITHIGGQSSIRSTGAQRYYRQSLIHFHRKHYSRLEQAALRILLPLYTATTR